MPCGAVSNDFGYKISNLKWAKQLRIYSDVVAAYSARQLPYPKGTRYARSMVGGLLILLPEMLFDGPLV